VRHKPRVWMKHDIKIKREVIGYLQLVMFVCWVAHTEATQKGVYWWEWV